MRKVVLIKGNVFLFLFIELLRIPQVIEVINGRNIEIQNTFNGVAVFEYKDISQRVFGASDFIAICRKFHTIIIKNIPKVTMSDRNAARRIILLVSKYCLH